MYSPDTAPLHEGALVDTRTAIVPICLYACTLPEIMHVGIVENCAAQVADITIAPNWTLGHVQITLRMTPFDVCLYTNMLDYVSILTPVDTDTADIICAEVSGWLRAVLSQAAY